jgi:hypothetical protein
MARDERWKTCIGTWDRLRWARLQRFETAKDAAIALGIEEGTYRAYERTPDSSKHTKLDHQKAMHFAKRLGVRWQWLLLGQGEPWNDEDEDIDRAISVMREADPTRRRDIADLIERLLKAG